MKLPIDNKEGLIVTLSVMRNGTGHDVSHFMEDKYIQSEGELVGLAKKAAEILWETHDIKKI